VFGVTLRVDVKMYQVSFFSFLLILNLLFLKIILLKNRFYKTLLCLKPSNCCMGKSNFVFRYIVVARWTTVTI